MPKHTCIGCETMSLVRLVKFGIERLEDWTKAGVLGHAKDTKQLQNAKRLQKLQKAPWASPLKRALWNPRVRPGPAHGLHVGQNFDHHSVTMHQ